MKCVHHWVMHDVWPIFLSEPIKYFRAVSIVVQENSDRFFENTIVLPNLPDNLHYLPIDTPSPHVLHHDSEIHSRTGRFDSPPTPHTLPPWRWNQRSDIQRPMQGSESATQINIQTMLRQCTFSLRDGSRCPCCLQG